MDPATVSIMNQITCCGYSRCNGCQCSSQSGRTYTYTYIYICGVRTSVCGTHGTQMNQQAEMRRDVRSCFIFVSSCGGERCRQHEVQVGVTVNTVWSRLEIWLWSNLEIRKWRLRGPEYFFLDEHVAWICGFGISALSIFAPRGLDLGCGLFWRTSKRTGRRLKVEWTSKCGTFLGCLLDRNFY
jgi:hypothetical protein